MPRFFSPEAQRVLWQELGLLLHVCELAGVMTNVMCLAGVTGADPDSVGPHGSGLLCGQLLSWHIIAGDVLARGGGATLRSELFLSPLRS